MRALAGATQGETVRLHIQKGRPMGGWAEAFLIVVAALVGLFVFTLFRVTLQRLLGR